MPTPNTPWEEIVGQAMDDCVDAFGEGTEQVTFTPAGGSPSSVDGIWEAESIDVDPETGARVISNNPQISFKVAALPSAPKNNDRVIVRGITYRVKEPIFDGQGTVTCRLWRV